MSALMDWIDTVFGMMSRLGPLRSRGGYSEVLKSVLTSVDLPRPDSPALRVRHAHNSKIRLQRTDNHHVEIETLADTLTVPLVG